MKLYIKVLDLKADHVNAFFFAFTIFTQKDCRHQRKVYREKTEDKWTYTGIVANIFKKQLKNFYFWEEFNTQIFI